MKNLHHYLIVLTVFASLGFTGCSKVKNAVSSSLGVGQCEVKATVSGAVSTSYSSNNLSSAVAKTNLLMNMNSSSISPIRMFTILLPANIATGTYNLKNNKTLNGAVFTYVHDNGSTGWVASSDNTDDFIFVVTKSTTSEIEGTFSGNMHNDNKTSITVSGGSFKAKF